MKKSRRFTIVVLTVAVSLAATGVALYVFVPEQIESRAEEVLAKRAKDAAEYIAAYSDVGLRKRDLAGVRQATGLASLDEDLAYAVVVGERGTVIASATTGIPLDSEWAAVVDDLAGADLEEAAEAVVLDEWLAATVYVGLHRTTMIAEVTRDRNMIAGFSGFLILLALGAGFGVFQMERLRSSAEEWQQRHKSVRLQAGNLYSSVREHRQNERSLKESESKYKSLFESTMASAMADLEELNRNLEKRKADLEHEVGVRKKAEKALRRYTQRLQLLNAVERSLLEGNSVQECAKLALQIAIDLVPAIRMSLVESDVRRHTALILGMQSKIDTGRRVGNPVPFSSVQSKPEISHVGDLEAKEELSESEKVLLAEGVRSYVDVPMVVQEEVVGVLCMESAQKRAFTEEHFSIARDVADLLAIGIHRARLDDERELYEQELVLARDRAEDMARLKTAFLTNMSHEIRTPISGIMGFSQVLHEEVPEPLTEFTGLIRESAHRLLNTINSVLELARLESGNAGVDLVKLDMAEEARETSMRLEAAAKRKGLSYRFDGDDAPVWCTMDRACLDRIVTNLVDNAIKFTDGGSVRVSVKRTESHAVLSVADTGVGISPEFLPQLFDEFRQEQMEANREHEGSGLGLAITKKLVDRLGGTINIQSEKGVGTTVQITFALHESSRMAAGTPSPVLLVTGSPDAAALLSEVVRPRYSMTTVTSPKDAVEGIADESWAAVVVDINCGAPHEVEEAARRIARKVGSARLLAVATQIIPKDTDRLARAGFGCFVSQPFAGDSLMQTIAEAEASPMHIAEVTEADLERSSATPAWVDDRPAKSGGRETSPPLGSSTEA
ncbi:MAG: GAF domain-containing sensor histidine kinase [Rhodothermales bacterium]|nr:GAF domain-containing sensor histidine kinase [Rhodothermales bacterium]MBO6778845.1 GAF domain-containing sensor histidine kinase [Rhodothermales bacterium]